jgi:SAM-dependent methyltransferase
MASAARKIANAWILGHAEAVTGRVLSIGSGSDSDWYGSKYRLYFKKADSYQTSDLSPTAPVNLQLDVRSMPSIKDASYDCVYCAGTLEHVDDMFGAMAEMARILKPDGTLLLGVPLGQKIHRAPQDFWRMTIHGLQYLLERFGFEEQDLLTIPGTITGFPSCYWSKSERRNHA